VAAARSFEALGPNERWAQPADVILAMSLHRERGQMVVEDLQNLPPTPLIVAEGSPLPASAAAAGAAEAGRMVWLLPTQSFQDSQLAAASVAVGPAALYRRLRDVIAGEATDYQLPIVEVDSSTSVEETLAAVESHFTAALEEGPGARNASERRSLLREINEATVSQVHGYYSRPWATGNGEEVQQLFVCECGDPDCSEDVTATVRRASSGILLLPGHPR
jgi:hypothetical protein